MALSAAPFEAGYRAVLERIAGGDPLPDILADVVRLIEAQDERMICSILLLDAPTRRLRHGASPRLPPEYSRLLDGALIGPHAGSCGTAAFRGERVIVEDIATHPDWEPYRHLAIPHGLRACWSSPVFSPQREVLGTFAMYYREPRRPTPSEIGWVDAATYLTAVVLLRDRQERERRRLEAALRAGDELRAFIYDHVEDVIFYLAVEGTGVYRFLSVNASFLRATGLSAEAVVGKRPEEVIPEPSRALVLGKYAEAIATGRTVRWEEVSSYPAGVRHGEVTISPLCDASGSCTNLVGTVRDITQRRRAEEERLRLEAQLHQSQRLQALGTLASGVAHDFNNFITAIRGNAELALEDPPGSPAAGRHLGVVLEASDRAAELVRRILAFGRPSEPCRALVSLPRVVDEALALLRSSVPRDVELRTRLADDLPGIHADPTQVHQAVLNLGTNALHALAGRGGLLELSAELLIHPPGAAAGPADLEAGQYVRLRVRDTGCGMDEATALRVFDPFFTTRQPGDGTGLGLAMVHGIMRSHRGCVTVHSQVGSGTTFDLYFPAASGPAEAAQTLAPGSRA